jgi:DNA-binding protein
LSDIKKGKDAEDILSEFHNSHVTSEPQLPSPESEPQLPSPESEPQLPSPESEPQLPSPESEPQLPSPETHKESSDTTIHDPEERDVIFVGTKPIMTYVSATLTQLSTRQIVTIKARGKRITQAVDVSQMIVKRMNTVGYVVADVRISSDSLTSQDGKLRNVSTIEIDITKN